MNETLIPLFSSLVMVSQVNLDEHEESLLNDFIDKTEFIKTVVEDHNPSSISKDLFVLDHESLASIRNKLAIEVNKYIEHMKYKGRFDFSSSWLTKTNPGEQSHYHTHHNAIFSGIYYVATTGNCGKLNLCRFQSSSWGISKTEANIYNSTTWQIAPQKGRLIIFPSNVPHKINVNKSKETRISLPFNIIPIGEIGEAESVININDKKATT